MPVRNEENETDLKEITFMPSTLETIDRAFFEFVDDKLNIFASTNKGWEKIPVIWVSAERAFQIKNNKEIVAALIIGEKILIRNAISLLIGKRLKSFPISRNNGLPGGCGTPSICDVAINSPVSQNDTVGAIVEK